MCQSGELIETMLICKTNLEKMKMKMLLIMAASCFVFIMFGTAQVYAMSCHSETAVSKDQKVDTSKGIKSDKAPDASATSKSSDASVKKGKAQTICPVERGEIRKNLYVDVKGKRIYVCCKGCPEVIKADPDKYIKILEDQGVEIENAPASSSK